MADNRPMAANNSLPAPCVVVDLRVKLLQIVIKRAQSLFDVSLSLMDFDQRSKVKFFLLMAIASDVLAAVCGMPHGTPCKTDPNEHFPDMNAPPHGICSTTHNGTPK